MPMDAIVKYKSHKQQLNKQFYTIFAHMNLQTHIQNLEKWIVCVAILYNHDKLI